MVAESTEIKSELVFMVDFKLVWLLLLSVVCILFPLRLEWQFLLPNGFILILALLFIRDSRNILFFFILAGVQDLFINAVFGLHFLIYILYFCAYHKILTLLQSNYWLVCWGSFSFLFFIVMFFNLGFYINLWGWFGSLYYLIVNSCCFLLFWHLLRAGEQTAVVGSYRIKSICQN